MATINVEAEKRAYKVFLAAGMTPAGACGLIGNLEAESDGFYPYRVEYLCLRKLKESGKVYTHESYTEAVDTGKISCEEFLHPLSGKQYGYGLAQWTSPGRKSGLYTLAKRKGVSIADEDMQLEYLMYELENSYESVLKVLKTATNIRTASDVVLKKFEIPSDTSEAVCAARAARGQKFYDDYVKGEETMHYISNCGHDENNKYSGGAAGDQTGGEWAMIAWYNRPWNCVLRHPAANVRQLHAEMAEAAAMNNCIGYDQYQRDTFGIQLKAAGDDPAKIKVKCETDCSKGIIDITKAIGRRTGRSELANIAATYTGNMKSAYRAAGYEVLTVSKYLTSPDYLLPGDILLNESHHAATNITKGAKVKSVSSVSESKIAKNTAADTAKAFMKSLAGTYTVTAKNGLNVRHGAGTKKKLMVKIPKGTKVKCYGYYSKASLGAKWLYVQFTYNNVIYTGFCSKKYLKK